MTKDKLLPNIQMKTSGGLPKQPVPARGAPPSGTRQEH